MDKFPNELLIHALSYLDYTSIARSCQVIHFIVSNMFFATHSVQVCKRWNEVVASSLLLNYLMELGREGLVDGNSTVFTAKSRQRTLRDHRSAWRGLVPTSTNTFTRDTKHLYEASGTVFAWGTGDEPHSKILGSQAARSSISGFLYESRGRFVGSDTRNRNVSDPHLSGDCANITLPVAVVLARVKVKVERILVAQVHPRLKFTSDHCTPVNPILLHQIPYFVSMRRKDHLTQSRAK
jgi:hypothetical protein